MSFSRKVKEEIIAKNNFKANIKPVIQGLFLSAGSLVISGGKISFLISNENEAVINFLKQKLVETLWTD